MALLQHLIYTGTVNDMLSYIVEPNHNMLEEYLKEGFGQKAFRIPYAITERQSFN